MPSSVGSHPGSKFDDQKISYSEIHQQSPQNFSVSPPFICLFMEICLCPVNLIFENNLKCEPIVGHWLSKYQFPIRGYLLEFDKKITKVQFEQIYFYKVLRILQNPIILRPEWRIPAQRLYNLQMKY